MAEEEKKEKLTPDIVQQVAERVDASDNVLVTLSKDPSVDELCAALGLTFILDKLGKHATAIFSGAVPNAIEFLEPEKTFEANTNSLQDFIIALDKEKADHLRYKIDGDFVKVFITPYKTTIDEADLEFSHGDYNVDLVIALNVESSADLDGALSEYGRIMHDATSVNVHAGEPTGFADLEWGDKNVSSVSEMVCTLADHLTIPKDKSVFDKSVATALLAGIVSATNRFSNEHTSADTMAVASRLMSAGADQQLISSSIPVDILTNDVVDANAEATPAPEATEATAPPAESAPADPSLLNIQHGAVDYTPEAIPATDATTPLAPEAESQLEAVVAPPSADTAGPLMEELKNAEINNERKTLIPPSEASIEVQPTKDYSAMMEAELAETPPEPAPAVSAPEATAPALPEMPETPAEPIVSDASTPAPEVPTPETPAPETPSVPEAPVAPEIPPIPEAPAPEPAPTPESMIATAELADNPLPMPDANTILPPPPQPFDTEETPATNAYETPVNSIPPTNDSSYVIEPQGVQSSAPAETVTPTMPPVDTGYVVPSITPAGDTATATAEANATNLGANPAMPDQLYPDPNAYRIPGT